MTAPATVAALRVTGLAGLVAVVGLGAAGLVSGFFEQSADRTTSTPGPVTALDVTTGAGDVTVETAPAGSTARVTATRHWAFGEPTTTETLDGGTLRLRSSCGAATFGRCSVDWVVVLPAGATLDVRTGAGDVHLDGTDGAATVRTGTGEVVLRDGRSPVLSVTTGTGDVRLGFAAAPRSLSTTTGAGDVSVSLPGGTAYRVEGRTGAGSRQVDVRQDPASEHVVRVDTGAGDVTLSSAG